MLDEEKGWSLSMESLKGAIKKAREEGKNVRGMVFINPGNPTGQCLSRENLQVGGTRVLDFGDNNCGPFPWVHRSRKAAARRVCLHDWHFASMNAENLASLPKNV